MVRGIKSSIKNMARRFGLEIKINDIKSRDDLRLVHFLNLFDIRLVLDVGANIGQFAESLFEEGYNGRVVSFEALPEAHAELSRAAEKFGSRWTVAPRMALSDRAGEASFHVTATDTASSLFRPSDSFVSVSPQGQHVQTIKVPTARLDDMVEDLDLNGPGLFLKLDVQGGEPMVLSGAPKVLAASTGLMTEFSLVSLYEDQPPSRDVLETIYAADFEVWDVFRGYRNPNTHRLNQVDLICFKNIVIDGPSKQSR